MSVIYQHRVARRRWLTLWPLALFLLLATGGVLWLWQAWSQVMVQSIVWQRDVNQQMSGLLKAVAANPTRAGGSLLLFSFIYGVLHALGPGHGKIVITTAGDASFEAEVEHRADAGLVLITGAGGDRSGRCGADGTATARPATAYEQFMAGERQLCAGWRVGGFTVLAGVKKLRTLLRRPTFTAFTPHHVHDERCGCGHQHVPNPEQLQSGDDWRARLMIILSMGMRPCSGAIMVLLFSKVVGVFGWGMASALAMAAGTSLTITSLALLVHSFRRLAVKLSGNRAPVLWRQMARTTLALAGGAILVVAAVVMWVSAVPVGRGLRPF